MAYKYLLLLIPISLLIVSVHGASSVYYTGYWTADQGIRLYNICCSGAAQIPSNYVLGNYIRVYTPLRGNIASYISKNGLSFYYESNSVIGNNSANITGRPSIIPLENGGYRIYYSVQDGRYSRIYTAVSDSGVLFTGVTPVLDPNDSSFNNVNGFASDPAAQVFPNGTIGLYYVYTSSTSPTKPCDSLFGFATSNDGIDFTDHGCVNFALNRSYTLTEPTWTVLQNGSVMLISATPAPFYITLGMTSGLYVSYSEDNTFQNFTAPKLILVPPPASTSNSIDLLKNPDLLYLANGTYRVYYDVYPAAKGSFYNTPSNAIYIVSASWIPTPNIAPNSTSTVKATTLSTMSTVSVVTTSLSPNSTVEPTTVSQGSGNGQQGGSLSNLDYIIAGIVVGLVVIALAVALHYKRKRPPYASNDGSGLTT